eukprot:TRINITY_DN8005_c0_g1_i1.p1 TRINITY_DN8005_c0_g1~~TRINITY_DN8005_c0_g1_i1.p1  ORF type:complete len:274 (-),score=47.79 TRINITY_DN8005_c0_g1_i1:20-841(-)
MRPTLAVRHWAGAIIVALLLSFLVYVNIPGTGIQDIIAAEQKELRNGREGLPDESVTESVFGAEEMAVGTDACEGHATEKSDEPSDSRLFAALRECKAYAIEHQSGQQQGFAMYMHTCVLLAVSEHPLIFGLGYDSLTYQRVNPNVVFVEDNADWIENRKEAGVTSRIVEYNYTTKISARNELLDDSEIPTTLLSVLGERWDFVLVDAPKGYALGQPGRYESIKFASLVPPPVSVCVHDTSRKIESMLFARYFGEPHDVLKQREGHDMMCKYK